MTPTEHRRFIEARLQRSPSWRWVHAFGSLKLAVILLISISVACAAATFAESSFSIKVARYYIYDAPWFNLWLGLLVLNLLCAALTRWPWQRRHVGFVITHAGIILLLAGAWVGKLRGFEGTVTLKKGAEPTNVLVIDETLLQVESPESGVLYEAPLPVAARRPRPDRPRVMDVPHSELKLVVDDYAEDLTVRARVEADPSRNGPAGVELELNSSVMAQSLPVPLALAPVEARNFDMFGRARIEISETLPALPKAGVKAPAATFRETQMIFARMPGTPITHSTTGKSSGHVFILESAGGDKFNLKWIRPDGSETSQPLAPLVGKPATDSLTGATLQVQDYWPDLRMVDGRPVSASERPDNPAVLLVLSGPVQDLDGALPVLRLSPRPDGAVAYQSLRGNRAVAEGFARAGESFATGWADWKVTVRAVHPHSRIRTVAERAAGSMSDNQTISGIRVALRSPDGRSGEPVWLPSGTSRILELDGAAVRTGFGLKVHRLDFLVSLEEFTVPRVEGSTEPENFISDVRFDGQQSDGPVRARIQMNDPSSYPPQWWRGWTGFNYKFSQAGWDPDHLDQTTLQVLHDPGWFLKWTGSLLICGGIFTMFYLIPRNAPARRTAPAEAATEATSPSLP